MIDFDRSELLTFLRALDRHLDERTTLVVVGGAAASVEYRAETRTSDVDVMEMREGSEIDLARAVEEACRQTGLAIDVDAATITELPYGYEERLRPVRGQRLAKLQIWVPEKYDLALSKMLRGYPHDLDAVEGMHGHHPLSKTTLVTRFEEELMNIATADRRKICLNVAMLAARLYGLAAGEELARRWGVSVPTVPRRR